MQGKKLSEFTPDDHCVLCKVESWFSAKSKRDGVEDGEPFAVILKFCVNNKNWPGTTIRSTK